MIQQQTALSESAMTVIMTLVILVAVFASMWNRERTRRLGLCEVGCGHPYACGECLRCNNRECNAGCLSCRPRAEWDGLTRAINDAGKPLRDWLNRRARR